MKVELRWLNCFWLMLPNNFGTLLLANPLVRPGKIFNFPAYYVGRTRC